MSASNEMYHSDVRPPIVWSESSSLSNPIRFKFSLYYSLDLIKIIGELDSNETIGGNKSACKVTSLPLGGMDVLSLRLRKDSRHLPFS